MDKDYYSILQLSPSASRSEIQKKYFELAKLHHPDVTGDTDGSRDKFKLINEAYSILSNPQRRREYDESLRKGKVLGEKSAGMMRERSVKAAALAYEQAQAALRYRSYEKAILLLKSAVKNDPSVAVYHSWYGFALAMANSNLHEARDECKTAVQMEFYNPDFRANLGFVYFRAGLRKLAIQNFMDALQWDPSNKLAGRYMEKIEKNLKSKEGPIEKVFKLFRRA